MIETPSPHEILLGRDAARGRWHAVLLDVSGEEIGREAIDADRLPAFVAGQEARRHPRWIVRTLRDVYPELLAAATLEVVDLVQAWADLRPGARVLDLGCGTGRVAGALLAKGMEVIGLDVSGRMLAVARGRHPGLLLAQVPGQDLACVRSGSVDAVLAVDVMPYLTRAGGSVAGAMMRDIARVLRPGGTAVILNWSYDDAQAGPLEVCEALSPLHGPEQPFRLWDARAWALRATR